MARFLNPIRPEEGQSAFFLLLHRHNYFMKVHGQTFVNIYSNIATSLRSKIKYQRSLILALCVIQTYFNPK